MSEPCATLNPAKLVFSLVRECLKYEPRRFNLQCQTEATNANWDDVQKCWRLQTNRGTIRCKTLIDCRNGYGPGNLDGIGVKLVTPVRGQIHQLQLVPGIERPSVAVSCNRGYEYFYYKPDGDFWLMGGGREWVNGMECNVTDDSNFNKEISDRMSTSFVSSIYGLPAVKLMRCWTGIMAFSKDSMPWVGILEEGRKGPYFVSKGYTGHGMPNAFLCAKAVSEMALDLFHGSLQSSNSYRLPVPYRTSNRRGIYKKHSSTFYILALLLLLLLLLLFTTFQESFFM